MGNMFKSNKHNRFVESITTKQQKEKQCVWYPQAEISSANLSIFNLERSLGPTFLGTPHHPILTKIPTPILAFPSPCQPPMPPYGQIRSRTPGFMWSLLCKAPQLSQNPHFPVFQGLQVGPSIRAYATVWKTGAASTFRWKINGNLFDLIWPKLCQIIVRVTPE